MAGPSVLSGCLLIPVIENMVNSSNFLTNMLIWNIFRGKFLEVVFRFGLPLLHIDWLRLPFGYF